MPPVNDVLFDRAVRHAIYVNNFGAHIENEIAKFLIQNVYPDLEQKLLLPVEALQDLGLSKGRIQALERAIRGTIAGGLKATEKQAIGELEKFAISEAKFETSLLSRVTPVEFTYLTPSPETLRQIILNDPIRGDLFKRFNGKTIGELFTQANAETQDFLEQQILTGIAEGESNQQIRQRIIGTKAQAFTDGAEAQITRNITAIARTATNQIANKTREAVYAENDDIIKAVRYVATLDTRTTLRCQGLDGNVYPIGEGPRPPQHFQCRSTTTPVLKSWRELGYDIDELPAGERAAMNGRVPADQNYQQWLEKQPNHIQDDALGVKRAEAFRNDNIKIDQFVNRKGETLTLRELEKKENIQIFDKKETVNV